MGAKRAFIIGIDGYTSVRPLRTAVSDASSLAKLLEEQHGYSVLLLREGEATLAGIRAAFEQLAATVAHGDRLLFYFAGHGLATAGDEGPDGYLVPFDAQQDLESLLPMAELRQAFSRLACRHVLAVLDCCFAGAFRWASARDLLHPPKLFEERYARYLKEPAWLLLTSAAHNELAPDAVAGKPLGLRDESQAGHSPFCQALLEGLAGAADVFPLGDGRAPSGDGVITATELFLYVREAVNRYQTVGMWPMDRAKYGEYIFDHPTRPRALPSAPALTREANPYRGLESYREADGPLFFGRKRLMERAWKRLMDAPFLVLTGASGSGKSSLLQAGLCASADAREWKVLPSLRPGRTPLEALTGWLAPLEARARTWDRRQLPAPGELAQEASRWLASHPGQRLLFPVDQLEELVRYPLAPEVRTSFLQQLAALLEVRGCHVACTVRSDFEAHFRRGPLGSTWARDRLVVLGMTQDELRLAIEGPASVQAVFFEPPSLVDRMVNEVVQMPGALPLLSFTLSELYLNYVRDGASDRLLRETHHDALGGVAGALRHRAQSEYDGLPDDASRATMMRLLLRMVSVESGTPTRRQMRTVEAVFPDAAEQARTERILQTLVEARLVVAGVDGEGQGFHELAHDQLIQGWGQLDRWILEHFERLTLLRRLGDAAQDWDEHPKEHGLWHDDPRLEQARKLLKETPEWLNSAERRFVQQSQRRRRTLSAGWTALGLGLAAAAVIAGVVGWLRMRSEAEGLYGTSHYEADLRNDPVRGLLLAARAMEKAPVADPRRTVYATWAMELARRAPRSVRSLPETEFRSVATDSALRRAVMWSVDADGKQVRLSAWDLQSGEQLRTPDVNGEPDADMEPAVSRDGRWAAAITGEGPFTLRMWELDTGRLAMAVPLSDVQTHNFEPGEDSQTRLAFTGGGLLTLRQNMELRAFDPKTGREVGARLESDPIWGAFPVSETGDYTLSVTCTQTAPLQCDIAAVELRSGRRFPGTEPLGHVTSVVFTPDARLFATVAQSRPEKEAEDEQQPERYQLRLWETTTGKLIRATSLESSDAFTIAAISADGKSILTSGWIDTEEAHGYRLWQAGLTSPVVLPTSTWDTEWVRLSPDGQRVILKEGGIVHVRDMWPGRTVRPSFRLQSGNLFETLTPDGLTLVVLSQEGVLSRWDIGDPRGSFAPAEKGIAVSGPVPGEGQSITYVQGSESFDEHFVTADWRITAHSLLREVGEGGVEFGPWLQLWDTRHGSPVMGELWLSAPYDTYTGLGPSRAWLTSEGELWVVDHEGRSRHKKVLRDDVDASTLKVLAEALTGGTLDAQGQFQRLTEADRQSREARIPEALRRELDERPNLAPHIPAPGGEEEVESESVE
ncbi:caspase family protein [Pyxidicoccus sp. 3LG]